MQRRVRFRGPPVPSDENTTSSSSGVSHGGLRREGATPGAESPRPRAPTPSPCSAGRSGPPPRSPGSGTGRRRTRRARGWPRARPSGPARTPRTAASRSGGAGCPCAPAAAKPTRLRDVQGGGGGQLCTQTPATANASAPPISKSQKTSEGNTNATQRGGRVVCPCGCVRAPTKSSLPSGGPGPLSTRNETRAAPDSTA